MHYLIKLSITLLTIFSSSVLIAMESLEMSADPRIRSLQYQPNEVYLLRGLHGFHTTVQLNEDENIQNIDLGDASAWNLNANGNIVTLKPIADNADTNMTIRTDKRLYLFQLTTPTLKRDEAGIPIFAPAKDALFLLRFIYPQTTVHLGQPRSLISAGLIAPPTKVHNRYYTARGDNTVLPRAVYDDGQFTYLDYTGIQAIPAVYTVDKKRRESLVNKRVEGEWVVIEGIARQYTLRHGSQVASVFNDMTIRR
jgi:type IV secretion system protein VirB9